MTTAERAEALSDLLTEHELDRNILRQKVSRVRWLKRVVPLLNFNPSLHNVARKEADVLFRRNLSNEICEQAEARLLVLIRRALAELGELTPRPESNQPLTSPREEDDIWKVVQRWLLSRKVGWAI